MNTVRVRFAPSPTGPLHIGGVRTALYNYLFAKKNKGVFILRIEDTDRARYVSHAEQYIIHSLRWLGLIPTEGPGFGGEKGPYRQSERKELYRKYALDLVESGMAYYAFDTAEDLDNMRSDLVSKGIHSPKYDASIRYQMKNSLNMSENEIQKQLETGKSITIRLKVPEDEVIQFEDVVRGNVSFASAELDDKILLKADGMPTYHLANVVDDHCMSISHVIRGEEWLSSTAHHVLLYKAFGWSEEIPKFAHLPLIMKPTGKGKLSKRDGQKFGFPVFPLSWFVEKEDQTFPGFKEAGFLPEALLNFLVLLGWNPGTDQELFSLEEMICNFSLDNIVKSGAKFDIDKAKWFNQQYLISKTDSDLERLVRPIIEKRGFQVSTEFLQKVCGLMKERVDFLPEFVSKAPYFFENPTIVPHKMIRKKYNELTRVHFQKIEQIFKSLHPFDSEAVQNAFKSYLEDRGLSFGDLMPLLRITITGTLQGPGLFEIIELIGKQKTIERMNDALESFDKMSKDS